VDIQRAIDDAARAKLLPVYALHGSERMLITRAVEALRKATVGEGPRGLSEDHYEAAETRAIRVTDACRMLPMLSKWRFVLVRNAHEWKSEDLEAVATYANAPTPSTVLVLVADKFDGRTKTVAALKKKGLLFEAEPPREDDLVPWLEAEAKRRGATFAPGATTALVLAVGPNLGALSDALERVHLYAAGRAITEEDIDEGVTNTRDVSRFDLPDAIVEKNPARALPLLHNVVKQLRQSKQREAAGLLILGLVASKLRQLARARDAMDKGEDLASAKIPPFLIGRVTAQARRWTAPQLSRALRICARLDERLKSGGGRDRDLRLLEEMILALAGAPGMGESALR
jgi:DNA polymerase-3 subunit delta